MGLEVRDGCIQKYREWEGGSARKVSLGALKVERAHGRNLSASSSSQELLLFGIWEKDGDVSLKGARNWICQQYEWAWKWILNFSWECSCQPLDFGFVRPWAKRPAMLGLDFVSAELSANKWVVPKATKCVIICYAAIDELKLERFSCLGLQSWDVTELEFELRTPDF